MLKFDGQFKPEALEYVQNCYNIKIKWVPQESGMADFWYRHVPTVHPQPSHKSLHSRDPARAPARSKVLATNGSFQEPRSAATYSYLPTDTPSYSRLMLNNRIQVGFIPHN
ncbi:hypothetical protein ABEW05_004846 [Botrytis cinerea]